MKKNEWSSWWNRLYTDARVANFFHFFFFLSVCSSFLARVLLPNCSNFSFILDNYQITFHIILSFPFLFWVTVFITVLCMQQQNWNKFLRSLTLAFLSRLHFWVIPELLSSCLQFYYRIIRKKLYMSLHWFAQKFVGFILVLYILRFGCLLYFDSFVHHWNSCTKSLLLLECLFLSFW